MLKKQDNYRWKIHLFLTVLGGNNQDNSIWTASCLPSWQLGHCPALRHPPSVLSLSFICWWFNNHSYYEDDDDSQDDDYYHSYDDNDEKTNLPHANSSLIVDLISSMTRLCKNVPKLSQNLLACLLSTTLVEPPPIFCKHIHGPILVPLSLSLNNIFASLFHF